ncbi:apolipoprotein N-acyltransferase [Francisella adeliensis]|uniref:Apolipoprotein N-acyltransferase n=1 Tax=Francisella adeliensis TaxID=2007306 RepID=A0A2Z4XYH2_9GAMM|nr:apolipoprotein N-acyltransferase [Francisella adeliensis]AXA33483.1 apolipoprotein N-acyltransferase [Francisella adeliensis]MBK2084821.1 apolipoprotein N-acyltransferase [Francisella adeliensis]MBK2097236.1 apolipoprotein N-acyltransferase [Francisella adeliensis]QIW11714.1 apolipoprotein N-acyltransferase [Francisella adeliensis]QIW13588.1 apolipoprotein N-acyltransferase [Francisella adeliensis]
MKRKLLKAILIILSGAVLTLAFAPFRIDILAIVGLCIFFYLLSNTTSLKQAFCRSLLFGIGFFGTSISWVYVSIHLFTESIAAGTAAAVALVILLSFLHIVPFAICSYLLTKNSRNYIKLIVYPALWTLFEIVKANLLWGGFPWVSIGYSQTESPLIWFANIGGVYLVSYVVAFISCLIVFYMLPIIQDKKLKKPLIAIIIIGLLYLSGAIISIIQPDYHTSKEQKVTLVQGDFGQGFKWERDNFIKMKAYYKKIAEQHQNSLIILSENAVTSFRQYQVPYFNELTDINIENNNAMLVGSLNLQKVSDNTSHIYNSSIIVGNGHGVYNKHHLVPFGEYFPIKFFGYVDSAGLSNFNQGRYIQPLMDAFGTPLANFMCYETAYPEQIRDQLQGAGYISIISDDSWFGDSIARYQQLQISEVRAIENSKFVLSTTSNGITAIIAPDGTITKQIPKDIRANLEGNIYINHFKSIWGSLGMSIIYILILFSIFLTIVLKISTETKKYITLN